MIDQKKKRIIIVSASVAMIAIIIVAVIGIIQKNINDRAATLSFFIAPESSKIEIDGKSYKSGDQIEEGEYTATISKEGFETQTIEFVARAGEKVFLETYLIQNDGGEDWYATHEEDDEIRWYIDENRFQAKLEEFYNNNPILRELPIKIEYYSNDYSTYTRYEIESDIDEGYTSFIIKISDYTGGNYENALSKIRNAGFDPEDYTIEYHDYTEDDSWGKAL